jgi:hyperosmotically inducible periplasmic protein
MKTKFAITCVLLGTLLGSAVVLADEDAAATGSHAAAYVKDSTITTKVKAKLAADHLTSLARIHVDTDTNGVVWLSGSARTHDAIRKAVSIARHTDGVRAVHNDITINDDE